MKTYFKQLSFAVIIVFTALAFYFGSYLPWLKSTRYIIAVQQSQNVHTIQDFENNLGSALDFKSPIGQEEVVKFSASTILAILAQSNQSETASRALVSYIEPHIFKDNVRHLISLGQMYFILAKEFGHEEDLSKAIGYYEKARAIGPNLPPVLYGLAQLYQLSGNQPKFQEVARTIISLWPEAGTSTPVSQ